MEAMCGSKMSVAFHRTTLRFKPEDRATQVQSSTVIVFRISLPNNCTKKQLAFANLAPYVIEVTKRLILSVRTSFSPPSPAHLSKAAGEHYENRRFL
jgi:hypothetical protein